MRRSLLFPIPYSPFPASRALVLDGDSRAALAIVRSLGRRQIHVIVASEEKASLAGCSKWCSERLVYPCPRAAPHLFEDWLISALALMPDAVLFVASDVTASIAGKCRTNLPLSAQALLPPRESLEIALDKSATLDLASRLGVPVPRSAQFTRGEAIDETCVNLGYPAAIKAAQSDLPYRCATAYARDPGEFRILLEEVLRECPVALVQEVISGEGTAIFALFDMGKPLVTLAHRRLIEKPPWGGVSALCESIEAPPDALAFALDMLQELKWHGPAMVEFKRNSHGVPCLMEINPRFWGSLELAIRSGADFPYTCMQLALGESIETPSTRPAVNRWVLGELDSLITALLSGVPGRSRIAELGSHLRGLRYGPCCEVERLSDFRPAVYEYAAWLRTSAGRFATRWRELRERDASGGCLTRSSPLPREDASAQKALRSIFPRANLNSLRGVVHVHSVFSADGLLSIGEIARRCAERGLSFAALADHAEDVDETAMRRLVAACEGQSRNDFALIPGLEHRLSEHVHILALGQKRLVTAASTIETLEAISDDGCVLVASHCAADSDIPARVLEILTAVEIWNVSRHTRFLPIRGGIAAYRLWSRAYPNLLAIGGLDMHSGHEWGCEVVLDRDCEITPDSVLRELVAGRFCTKGRFASFDSRPAGGVRDIVFAAGDALAGVRDVCDRVLR